MKKVTVFVAHNNEKVLSITAIHVKKGMSDNILISGVKDYTFTSHRNIVEKILPLLKSNKMYVESIDTFDATLFDIYFTNVMSQFPRPSRFIVKW